MYAGWQWRNFFIPYLCQLFSRHDTRQALRMDENISYHMLYHIQQLFSSILRACRVSWQENSWHKYGMKKLRHCHPAYIIQNARTSRTNVRTYAYRTRVSAIRWYAYSRAPFPQASTTTNTSINEVPTIHRHKMPHAFVSRRNYGVKF